MWLGFTIWLVIIHRQVGYLSGLKGPGPEGQLLTWTCFDSSLKFKYYKNFQWSYQGTFFNVIVCFVLNMNNSGTYVLCIYRQSSLLSSCSEVTLAVLNLCRCRFFVFVFVFSQNLSVMVLLPWDNKNLITLHYKMLILLLELDFDNPTSTHLLAQVRNFSLEPSETPLTRQNPWSQRVEAL